MFYSFLTRNREIAEEKLFSAVADRLSGKCCRQDCKAYKCRPGCLPFSKCKKTDKGLFVEVRYFQLLGFDIHDDVKSRYLRQVIEREQEEQATFELREKVSFISDIINCIINIVFLSFFVSCYM